MPQSIRKAIDDLTSQSVSDAESKAIEARSKAVMELIRKRAEAAKEVRDDIASERKKIELAKRELELANEMRKSALGNDGMSKEELVPSVTEINRRFQVFARNKKVHTDRYLATHQADSKAVEYGIALNHLAEIVAPNLVNCESQRKQLAADESNLRILVANDPTNKGLSEQLRLVHERQTLLKSLRGGEVLNDYHRGKIKFQRGDSSSSFVLGVNDGAMTVNWNVFLVLPENDLREACGAVERAKRQVIKELREDGYSSIASITHLSNSVDHFEWKFNRYCRKYMKELRHYHTPTRTRQYSAAKHRCRQLRKEAASLSVATNAEDVQQIDFSGKTVDELVVYMYANGLTFDRCAAQGQGTYSVIHRELLAHYLKIKTLQRTIEYTETDLRTLANKDDQLANRQYDTSDGIRTEDLEAIMQDKPSALEEFKTFSDILVNVKTLFE